MKNNQAVKKIEKQLGIETKYYFTINRVKTFVDDGELNPIDNEVELNLYTTDDLKELGKKVKDWMKRKKAGFVEDTGDEFNILLTFDTPDLTIYAVVYSFTKENGDVPLSDDDIEEFMTAIKG